MNLQQAMSYLEEAVPDFEGRQSGFSARCGSSRATIMDEHEFARWVANEVATGKNRRVQAAFDGIEEILRSGEIAAQDWVRGCVEAVQDIVGWKESGEEVLLHYLGPETRRTWAALEAIRADLAESSILEAEVTMWRIAHHSVRTFA